MKSRSKKRTPNIVNLTVKRRYLTMAVGDQDHGRVAMPVAAMLAGAVHQARISSPRIGCTLGMPFLTRWGGRQDAIPDPPTHASPCPRVQARQRWPRHARLAALPRA